MNKDNNAALDEWQALLEQDPAAFVAAVAALSTEEHQEVMSAMEDSTQELQAQLEDLRAENERRRLWLEHYECEAGKWEVLS